MTGLAAALVDLVLPRRCVGCAVVGALLCRRCSGVAAPFAVAVDDLPVHAAAAYDDGMRRAVIAYKERGRRDLAGVLAAFLATALASLLRAEKPRGRLVLVAPPASRAAIAERGGDHVLRLARRAARVVPRMGPSPPLAPPSVLPGVLRATRRVRDSAGLGIEARERNLAGSMTARAPDDGDAVAVVVDDIVTTGATLREARRALHAAGWTVAGGAVVAATPRRLTAFPLAGPG